MIESALALISQAGASNPMAQPMQLEDIFVELAGEIEGEE